jgi:hypothetical protein
MKKLLPILALTAVVAGGCIARADTINFSQFGSNGTKLASPISGTTVGGVGVTLTSPTGTFEVLQEGSDWQGILPLNAPILFDGFSSGAITLNFATQISSLILAGQSNAPGAYTETALAYSGATLVDAVGASSYNYVSTDYPFYTGTAPFLTVTGLDITSVVFDTTNNGNGVALYGGAGAAVPEPGTVCLVSLGLAGVGLALRRKRIR